MEITLEKIELVKDRTGVSYKEAKEALEVADGSGRCDYQHRRIHRHQVEKQAERAERSNYEN